MKSPELRKELSELVLHKRGIRINLQLPLIESEDEIVLRDADTLAARLLALSLLHQFAHGDDEQKTTAAATSTLNAKLGSSLHACFSENERALLSPSDASSNPNLPDQRALNGEALRFLLWASGLVPTIGMPDGQAIDEKTQSAIMAITQHPTHLAQQIKVRSKSAILDWADLLYRLHWAVRHAHITGKPTPGRLDTDAVHEWHKAVNWLIRYDDEDDWDRISTETAG